MVITVTKLTIFVLMLGIISIPGVSVACCELIESAENQKISAKIQLAQIATPKPVNFSELDPTKSLGNVTAPLDGIWGILGAKLNLDDWQVYPKLLKSAPESLSGSKDTLDSLSIWKIVEIGKSAFVLVANILLAVMSVVTTILKGILGLIS